MSVDQRAAFDVQVGLTDAAPALPDTPDLPPELRGKTPPAWWTAASDGASWRPPVG